MNEPSLNQLEREVETARARLAGDLATLRSPATVSDFTHQLKEQAVATKDELIEKARTATQAQLHVWIDALKAKAAENPAAVLTIGAGLAWRMLHRPPIATALVGIGLFSLLRGNSTARAGLSDADYLMHAQARLKQQSAEVSAEITEKASSLVASAQERVADWRETATSELQAQGRRLADVARASTTDVAEQVDAAWDRAGESVARSVETVEQTASQIQRTAKDAELVDKLLLGAAGVAVAAALGMTVQRRAREMAGGD